MLAELGGKQRDNTPDPYLNFVEDMANKKDLAAAPLKPN